MRKFYLMMFLLACLVWLGNASQTQAQNTNESFIFDMTDVRASGGGLFTYSYQNSSVFGRIRDGNSGPQQCECYAGTTLNLRSHYSGNLSIYGGNPGLVNGNLYNEVSYTGSLVFDGGSYVLPMRYNRSRLNVTLPATLTGNLNGHAASTFNQNQPLIFTTQFNLQGTVTVTLQVFGLHQIGDLVRPYYKIHRVRYDFPRLTQNVQESNENSGLSK
jgi:hypothetical protein